MQRKVVPAGDRGFSSGFVRVYNNLGQVGEGCQTRSMGLGMPLDGEMIDR